MIYKKEEMLFMEERMKKIVFSISVIILIIAGVTLLLLYCHKDDKNAVVSEKDKVYVLSVNEPEKYNIYLYKLDNIEFELEGKSIDLKQALLSKEVTMEEVLKQAEKDVEIGKIKKDFLKDGGSKLFEYNNYTIQKSNSYCDTESYPSITSINKDVYIYPKDKYYVRNSIIQEEYYVHFLDKCEVELYHKLMNESKRIEEVIKEAENKKNSKIEKDGISTYIYDEYKMIIEKEPTSSINKKNIWIVPNGIELVYN